ncbi:hypothetical protein [Anaerococcus hydrogenalis]|uniref:DUF2178 domain-containing protein n=1 Tax=Anaerococcus hydrogenalis ACS-025-V-Sch4 TaxID=879306 RepID=F0GZ03_9FIRM|nr:hypothetical protein [Anaerococcus hydrogenalis]EGC84504.1 hypothetical protein HMPREF9246_0480 [Anaerococcus hydrogenalis ACS-025-V-Sch4]
MKNNKMWYFGYIVGFLILILLFTIKGNEIRNILLTLIFAISTSISSVKIMHNKMIEKDKSYRINVNDERNVKIKDKVNATMSYILLILIGLVALICLAVKAYLPAGILAIFIMFYPMITFFINGYYEKKY